ncbi:MAG: hypothetical protein ACLSDQ_05595 [Adlercreutzia equolifaciens]
MLVRHLLEYVMYVGAFIFGGCYATAVVLVRSSAASPSAPAVLGHLLPRLTVFNLIAAFAAMIWGVARLVVRLPSSSSWRWSCSWSSCCSACTSSRPLLATRRTGRPSKSDPLNRWRP